MASRLELEMRGWRNSALWQSRFLKARGWRENVEGPMMDCVARGQARWRHLKPSRE